MKSEYRVNGMHCASCAYLIKNKIEKIKGVKSCRVNYATENAQIDFLSKPESLNTLNSEIEKFGYSLSELDGIATSQNSKEIELAKMRTKVMFSIVPTLLVFILMLFDILHVVLNLSINLGISQTYLNFSLFSLSTVSLFWLGLPYLKSIPKFVRFGSANMDTLVGIGTSVAYFYSVIVYFFPSQTLALHLTQSLYFDTTIVVIGFISFGKYLEASSRLKTGEAIKKLLGLQSKTALVERDGKIITVPINKVILGDIIIVKPGAKIPVDGKVIDGFSSVDESMITGESIPVVKKINDVVIGGTINKNGSFKYYATKIGSDTMLFQIIHMVREAQASKTPVEGLVDKVSSIFVPLVLVIAIISLIVWVIVGSTFLGFNVALGYGLSSLIGTLVIACPCALGLATPTAIIIGTGKGAQNGILVKNTESLELLNKVKVLVFDKTGTLTEGRPSVIFFKNYSKLSDSGVLSLTYALELKSEHPLADAVVSYAKDKTKINYTVKNFQSISGKGVLGNINGKKYGIGSLDFAQQQKIKFDKNETVLILNTGSSGVFLFDNSNLLAGFSVSDKLKSSSKDTISRLHRMGLKTVLLTGDHTNVAINIASVVGIDTVYAEVLPKQKAQIIKDLQKNGAKVAMIGDGVNDAPALSQADVGIAMSTGTDVAIESAQITLLKGDLGKVVKAISLSKNTFFVIKQNLFWAFAYNVLGIPIAAGVLYPIWGITLNPIFAGMAMALSSASVVSNSLRLKIIKL